MTPSEKVTENEGSSGEAYVPGGVILKGSHCHLCTESYPSGTDPLHLRWYPILATLPLHADEARHRPLHYYPKCFRQKSPEVFLWIRDVP